MLGDDVFTQTEPHLLPILAELLKFEPIFHTAAFAKTPEEFDHRLAQNYWEVGASGTRYTRAFILALLAESPPVNADAEGWRTYNHGLQQLGPSTYLLTYSLDQRPRLTHRSSIWHSTLHGWQVLFHQGTLVAPENDDAG